MKSFDLFTLEIAYAISKLNRKTPLLVVEA
jgi:hypothetical protein